MELNSRDLVVPFGPTQARAMIGVGNVQHIFAMNPDEVKWSYKNNTVSRDTIGGRVVQILSSTVEVMSVTGRAGSRRELQTMSNNLKKVMQYQIKTSEPVNFKVPSRNWNFLVYIQNVSGLGWDVTTTAYPYELNLMIQDDLTGIASKKINQEVFDKLINSAGQPGIGYNPQYHGGNLTEATRYIEAMNNALNNVSTTSDPVPYPLGDESGAVGDLPGCESRNPNVQKISPNCKRFRDEIVNSPQFESIGISGIFCCKKTVDTTIWSDHSWGAAIDVGFETTPARRKQAFANKAVEVAERYQIKYVIYNSRIWNPQDKWHPYNGVDPHTSHVHVSFKDSGAGDGIVPPCA